MSDTASSNTTPAAAPGSTVVAGLISELTNHPDVVAHPSLQFSEVTTLRVGGPALSFLECSSNKAVIECVAACDRAGIPVIVLGGGSNLVVSDEGLSAIVVAVRNTGITYGDETVLADAGVNWDELVASTVDSGFGGLECLSGIPGSTGATPVQNVGAYGVEISHVLSRVRVWDRRERRECWWEPAQLALDYRTSVLKGTERAVVLQVEYYLRPDGMSQPIRYAELASALGIHIGARARASEVRSAVLALRRSKGMVLDASDPDTFSAGSFFTNPIIAANQLDKVRAAVSQRCGELVAEHMPVFAASSRGGESVVKLSAGWLIEHAGFSKGFPGPDAAARLSTKHTLALSNRGAAGSGDIIDLARTVRDGVYGAFGVKLHPEPVWVGCSID